MSVATDFEHGAGGYTNHGCRCDVCRAGQASYMRDYRRRNPHRRDRDVQMLRAYNEALRILRERHRDEFDALYSELRGDA